MHTPPPAVRVALDRLLQLAPLGPVELRDRVTAHLAHVVAVGGDAVDVPLAQVVGEACLALLEGWDTVDEDGRRHIQAACLYFVETSDDEDDLDSIVGFDDDAEAVAWVAARVGRPELADRLRAAWR